MKANRRVRREAKQLYRLCLVNGQLDEERAREVVRHVGAAQYRGRAALLVQLRRLILADRARRSAHISSAIPLDSDNRAAVRTRLERSYGPGLEAAFAEDPSLIAGMRIKVDCDVYDGSVKAALNALVAKL